MLEKMKISDIIAFILSAILSVASYILYEENIVVSVAIFLCVLLVYRRYIRNRKKKNISEDWKWK